MSSDVATSPSSVAGAARTETVKRANVDMMREESFIRCG